jgi:hypothetical protein
VRTHAAGLAAQQRVDPRDEDRPFEGLVQKVVGADLEPLDFVHLAVLRGQHQQWRVHARGAQVRAHAEAVAPRQHDVEHDDVEVAAARRLVTGLTVESLLDDKSLVGQQIRYGPREVVVVLDHENSAPFVTHLR